MSADPYVREVGRVEDMDGVACPAGVDYDTVTVGEIGSLLPYRFTQRQQEEFAHLFVSACWQAGHQHGRMTAVTCPADCGGHEHDQACTPEGTASPASAAQKVTWCWCCARWCLHEKATGDDGLCDSCRGRSPSACKRAHVKTALTAASP